MAVEQISHYSEGMLTYYFALVAKHLTGRETRIVWGDVIRGDYNIRGTVRKSGDTVTIYLRRGLGWDASMSVFLHECGHIKQDWSSIWVAGGRRERFPDFIGERGKANSRPLEDRASKQAKVWSNYARSKAGTSRIVPQLEALLKYRGEHG